MMKQIFFATLAMVIATAPAQAWQKGAGYLRLASNLDRPQDGYCLDVAGSGNWVDFGVPLNAHNCKGPHFYADEAVIFDKSPGAIRFPAYGGCVTAIGRNGRSLPKTALILKPCADTSNSNRTAFISLEMQTFEHRADGRIALAQTNLCMVVGDVSDVTFSPDHRWRALFLDDCAQADGALSIWKPFSVEHEPAAAPAVTGDVK